jgi:hypothetical protein
MSELQPMAQSDQTHLKTSMRKVALTALAGTSIEWYDFFLYATAAALVFPSAFFPDSDPTIGLVLSFGTFAFPQRLSACCLPMPPLVLRHRLSYAFFALRRV